MTKTPETEVDFTTVRATWRDRITVNTLTVHNTSKEEVLRRAKFFGYVEPKWYQFWRTRIEFYLVV